MSQTLICGICGREFFCEHDMSGTFQGQPLKVPHCWKCGFDDGKCAEKHEYMCGDCQKIGGEAFANSK